MNLKDYSLSWQKQSIHSGENMPCGGYDTGLCVWVEDGELLFYIDRSGSFDENNQMLKLGRIRLSCTPNPLKQVDSSFSQTLDLETGRILITGSCKGYPTVTLTVWCETEDSAIHVDVQSNQPIQVNAAYETWRFADRPVPPERRMPCYSMQGYPKEVRTFADRVAYWEGGVLFCHQNRNQENCFEKVAALQRLENEIPQMFNPQKDFIFGGFMYGDHLCASEITDGSYAGTDYRSYGLISREIACEHHLHIVFESGCFQELAEYCRKLAEKGERVKKEREAADQRALAFWKAYWQRSFISVEPANSDSPAWQIGRNYQLFRYMLGCNAHGTYPTKFNGGLFTSDACYSVSEEYKGETPDYRCWGGGSFTAQNQRLVYWPMLKSGDFDLMPPQFEFYRQALPNAQLRVKTYWQHEGCAFCEQVENFGLPVGYEWGWPDGNHCAEIYTHRLAHDQSEITGPWIKYHYSTQLEFCYMILKYAEYASADIRIYRGLIDSCIRFFDQHYRMRHAMNCVRELDQDGKYVFYPSTALETYKDATNPTELIAGLDAVLGAVLENHRTLFSPEELAYYTAIRQALPPIPWRTVEGKKVIAPAKSWSDIINIELPQLYPVFPYGQYGLGREHLEVAVNTYFAPADVEGQRDYISWHQDNIFAARLGLAQEAKKNTFLKLTDGPRRFPAYWGPGHDWVPDHNWGGSGMIGLQEMLLQTVGRRILLFPAWPREHDVHFKLHAEQGIVIEARMTGGKPEIIFVNPPERHCDVEICG